MVRVLNELADLCRVDNPDYFELCRNSEDVINKLTIDYAADHGLQTYFEDTYKKSLNETTIEDCLNAYEKGYSSVMRDGRFYGFKKAV